MRAPARRSRLSDLDPRARATLASTPRVRRTRALTVEDDGSHIVLEQNQLTQGRVQVDSDLPPVAAPPQAAPPPALWPAPTQPGPVVDSVVRAVVEPPRAEVSAVGGLAPPPAEVSPVPAAVAPSEQTGPLAGWEMSSSLREGDAFAQDIAAILQATGPPETVRPHFPLPVPESQPAPPPVPLASPGAGGQLGHAVFDVMSAPPQRFDAGPVALSVDFGELDRALAREQRTPATTGPAAVAPPEPGTGPGGHATVGGPGDPATVLVPDGPATVVVPGIVAPPQAPAMPPADDAPWPPPSVSAQDVAEVAHLAERARPFRVTTDVPLLPQVPGLSCHAAACASMVAWRDDTAADPAAAASATGYWERFAPGRTARFPDVLAAFGLAVVDVPVTPQRLRELVDSAGPLWVAASPPGEHAVVVAGLAGDGTTSGTLVDVVDPWARGMTTFAGPNPGSRYSVPLAELAAALGGDSGALVLARLQEGMLR